MTPRAELTLAEYCAALSTESGLRLRPMSIRETRGALLPVAVDAPRDTTQTVRPSATRQAARKADAWVAALRTNPNMTAAERLALSEQLRKA